MKKFLLAALLANCFIACSSDNDDRDENTNDVILPVTITSMENDGSYSYTSTIKYNGSKISEIHDYEGGKIVYQYDGDNIIKITDYQKSGKEDMTQVYTYKNGKVATLVTTEGLSGDRQYVTTSTYDWVTNNHVEVSRKDNFNDTIRKTNYYYDNENLIKTEDENTIITYTYDSNNNPLKNIKGMNVVTDSDYGTNNLIKKEYKSKSSGGSSNTYTTTHEYNTNNYPTKSITSSDGSSHKDTNTYIYNK